MSALTKSSQTKKTAEYFLNTDKKREIALQVQEKARIYQIKFGDLSIREVQNAAVAIQKKLPLEKHKMAAIEAGQALLDLEKEKQKLRDEGVPGLVPLELTRRILDTNIPNSKPYLF